MSRGIACIAAALLVASCGAAKNDGQRGSGGYSGSASGGGGDAASGGSAGGGIGGGRGGIGGSAGGGAGGGVGGGTAGTGGGGTDGDCIFPSICPAVYAPMSADASVGCTPPRLPPCWDDVPCGAGRRVSGVPIGAEDRVTCIYDGQGKLVSATTCGYQAHNTYCHHSLPSGWCKDLSRNSCDGSPLECFHLGADVTCPADAGSD